MTPNLLDYDWIFINTSGGKDSQTMMRQVMLAVDSQGFPASRVIAVHADLGRVEWPGVTELAREQAEHYGLPFLTISRPQGDLLEQVRARGKWPSPDNRYCTSDQKRDQIKKLVIAETRALVKESDRPIRVLNCMGMRAEESSTRAKLPVMGFNKRYSSNGRVVDNWLPIHNWTEMEVWNDITISGVRYHWAYDAGLPRLSCCFCIYMPEAVLALSMELMPDLYRDYIAVEKEIGHAFQYSGKEPLWLSRLSAPDYKPPARRTGRQAAWKG